MLLTLVPMAGAVDTTGCYAYSDPSAISAGDMYYVKEKHSDGQFYVVVYGESNSLPGLQTWHTSCGYGKPMIPPDTYITKISQLNAM